MQKAMPALPGGWGPHMLSVSVKNTASRGIAHLFLSSERVFLPTKVNVFMASIC